MGQRPSKTIVNVIDGTVDRIMSTGEFRQNIGCKHPRGYTIVTMMKRNFLRHRLIYLHFHGPMAPWMHIDHIHGVEAGDGIANLRWTTRSGNMQNIRKATAQNKHSGLLGAHWDNTRQCWISAITINNKPRHLGRFDSAMEAHLAYLKAKRELHVTCTI